MVLSWGLLAGIIGPSSLTHSRFLVSLCTCMSDSLLFVAAPVPLVLCSVLFARAVGIRVHVRVAFVPSWSGLRLLLVSRVVRCVS